MVFDIVFEFLEENNVLITTETLIEKRQITIQYEDEYQFAIRAFIKGLHELVSCDFCVTVVADNKKIKLTDECLYMLKKMYFEEQLTISKVKQQLLYMYECEEEEEE